MIVSVGLSKDGIYSMHRLEHHMYSAGPCGVWRKLTQDTTRAAYIHNKNNRAGYNKCNAPHTELCNHDITQQYYQFIVHATVPN